MKKTFFASLLALLLVTPLARAAEVDPAAIEIAKIAVLDLINAQRATLGLNPLEREFALETEIQTHVDDMAEGRVAFGHLGFDGRCDRVRETIGNARSCGEIVAWGQKTPERVHLAWTNSPGHYARMTDVRYTHAGLGYFVNEAGRPYWGILFIRHQ